FVASAIPAHAADQKYEAGGLATYTFLRQIGSTDSGVGTESAGVGARLVRHAFSGMDVEGEINFLPGNAATSGNHIQGLSGVKSGTRWQRLGLFAKARAGFFHFRRDPFGVGKPGTVFFLG